MNKRIIDPLLKSGGFVKDRKKKIKIIAYDISRIYAEERL